MTLILVTLRVANIGHHHHHHHHRLASVFHATHRLDVFPHKMGILKHFCNGRMPFLTPTPPLFTGLGTGSEFCWLAYPEAGNRIQNVCEFKEADGTTACSTLLLWTRNIIIEMQILRSWRRLQYSICRTCKTQGFSAMLRLAIEYHSSTN